MTKKYKYLDEGDVKRAAENGVSRELLRRRINEWGWTRERAVSEPKHEHKVQTGAWDFWKKVAVVSHGTFRVRLLRGWSEEAAATTPPSYSRNERKSKK